MSVIPITIFFSLLLAGGFVVLFAREQRRRKFVSAERDSLLPLADEKPRFAADASEHAHDHHHDADHDHEHTHPHDHAPGHGGCGCHNGARPPCVGCLRRTGADASAVSTQPR